MLSMSRESFVRILRLRGGLAGQSVGGLKPLFSMAFVLLLSIVEMASATTYVPISDPNLADQATAVARVKVLAVEPGPANRMPATDYLVEVEEVAKGYLPGSTLVVRVPGGVRTDGLGLYIAGAPRLQPGGEALLFLQPAADGTYGILHLMLGTFHVRRSGNIKIVVQDLSGAHRLDSGAEPEEREKTVRDLDRFTAWLADRASGLQRPANYWIEKPASDLSPPAKAHTLLPTPDGVPVRWFSFDSGGSVAWSVSSAGQPGLDLTQTVAAFQAALQAWTADPTSPIQYTYAGLTGATGGLRGGDRVNGVLFNDPGNAHVPGSYVCGTGGVVAIGGPYYYLSTRGFRGQTFHEAFEADVVTNDGAECFFRDNPQGAAEVFAHELGHTLGFGHATGAQALMWPKAHNDGRGARLGDDDYRAASVIYGDGSFQPAAPPPPAESLKLSANADKTQIQLSWNNPYSDIEGFRVESQQRNGSFRALLTLPADATTTMVQGLGANRAYALRVVAFRTGGEVAGSSNLVKIRTRK
jgi:hypothetical protein